MDAGAVWHGRIEPRACGRGAGVQPVWAEHGALSMLAGVFDAGAAAHVFAQHPGSAAGKRVAFGPVSPSGRRQDAQALPLPQVSSKGARAARQGKDPDHLPQVRREIYKKDLRVIAIARELDIIKLEFTKRSDF